MFYVVIPEGHAVNFSEVAAMMAKALEPADRRKRQATEANLREYVLGATLKAPDANTHRLIVRNRETLVELTHPSADELSNAVVLPQDLRLFFDEHGIELRMLSAVAQKNCATLEHAATEIAEQQGWSLSAANSLLDAMEEAVRHGDLVPRNPHTGMTARSDRVNRFFAVVAAADVNDWLERERAGYQWNRPTASREADAASVGVETREEREDRRLKMCEDEGLKMDKTARSRLPDGVGKVAAREGVSRQAFSQDVKNALQRKRDRRREGGQ